MHQLGHGSNLTGDVVAPGQGPAALWPEHLGTLDELNMVADDSAIIEAASSVNADSFDNPLLDTTRAFAERAQVRLSEFGIKEESAGIVFATSIVNATQRARAAIEAKQSSKE